MPSSKSPEQSEAFSTLDRVNDLLTQTENCKAEVQIKKLRVEISALITTVSPNDIIDYLLETDAMPEDIRHFLSCIDNPDILEEISTEASEQKKTGPEQEIIEDIETISRGIKVSKESIQPIDNGLGVPVKSTAPYSTVNDLNVDPYYSKR